MEVNSRMIGILENIWACDGHISIQDAVQATGISRRTLIYNIEKINSFLLTLDKTPVEISRGYLRWDMSQEQEVKRALGSQHKNCYVLSKEERKAMIAICAGVICKCATLDMLCNLFDVSRNTVVAEIGELKLELAEIGLRLRSFGRSGYILEGEETTVRYYVMECFYSLHSRHIFDMAQAFIRSAAEQVTGKKIGEAEQQRFCSIIEESERQTSLHLNNNSIREAVLYLLLILIRANNGHHVRLDTDIGERSEYVAAGRIIDLMAEMGFYIPKEEQGYITTVLLASKVFDISPQPGNGNVDLKEFTSNLVDTFSAKACVRFDDREGMVERLLLHVRPMYYRLKYKIKVRNVLTSEIQSRYRELYNLTDLSVKTIEGHYGFTVPDDEIAYLCVYIGGWMKRQMAIESSRIVKILIVCESGIGTSLLLKDQMCSLLGDGYLYVVKDKREADCSDCSEYELIVTTAELHFDSDKVLRVNPILTRNQQNKLLAWNAKFNGNAERYRVNDILEIIRRHTVIADESILINDLLSCLTKNEAGASDMPADILRILPPDHVEITDREMDAAEAIRFGCRVLIEKEVVGKKYPSSILEIIDTLGLYAEIADGILLAHGKPDEDVKGVGLTVSLFRKPVLFSKWKKEITVIFTLATPDNELHLPVLRDIMALLRIPENCKKLTQCKFADSREAYDYILKGVEQEKQ